MTFRKLLILPCILLFLSANSFSQDHVAFEVKIREAELAGDSLQKIAAYYNYGTFLDDRMDYELAAINLKRALQIASSIEDNKSITEIANHLGGTYWSSGDCEASTAYFEQALEHAERIEDEDMIAMIKMNLSGNYNSAGDRNKAVEYALSALDIKESKQKLEGICYDYTTVGEIFENIGNRDKWKLYIRKAYELKDVEGCADMNDWVTIYNNLGSIAQAEEQYVKALAYFDTMKVISQSNEYDEGVGIALLNSANVYQLLEKPTKALEITYEAEQHLGDVPYFIMAVNNVKAELLQELERYPEALDMAMRTLQNEELDYYPILKEQCFSLLYAINLKLENYSSAFAWNDTLNVYKNHLNEEENRSAIEELETKYQSAKKEQQIELLTTENKLKHQRIWLLVAASFIMLLVVILVLFIYLKRQKENRQREEGLKQQLLRSQMNPHFLFNALGSIQNFMLKNETKRAAGYLNNFALLTRNILEHSSQEFVSVSDEIETLRNYIELEKMRLDNSFDFEINYDENWDADFINIPPMLIQPFVENAIKHGLNNIEYKGFLELRFEDKGSILHIEIIDNGVGIDSDSSKPIKKHKSMSMGIFEQRKIIFAKRTKHAIRLEVTDRKNISSDLTGTLIKMDIPIVIGP